MDAQIAEALQAALVEVSQEPWGYLQLRANVQVGMSRDGLRIISLYVGGPNKEKEYHVRTDKIVEGKGWISESRTEHLRFDDALAEWTRRVAGKGDRV